MRWWRIVHHTIVWTGRRLAQRVTHSPAPPDGPLERGYVQSDGTRIHYMLQGSGEPVLLVHGYGVSANINWKMPGIWSALAREFRVIALDVRGHGRSGKPHDVDQYGLRMVDDVVRLMDHLGLSQAHLVGYSMGGFILLHLLARQPHRFLSAVLGGSGGIRPNWPLWDWSEELACHLDRGFNYPQANIAAASKALLRPLTAAEKMLIRSLPDSNDPRAMAAVIRSWRHLSVSDAQLQTNAIPTLLVHGTDEFPGMVEYIAQLHNVLPMSELRTIAGTDHFDTVLCPDFLRIIHEFLTRRSTSFSPRSNLT